MDKLTKHAKILNDLRRAGQRLKEAVELEPTEINQDATIQRFEFNFELCWKLMKTLVEFKGKSCASPRDCIRIAANIEITDNPREWISFLNDRNALSHQYKEVIARPPLLLTNSSLQPRKFLPNSISPPSPFTPPRRGLRLRLAAAKKPIPLTFLRQ